MVVTDVLQPIKQKIKDIGIPLVTVSKKTGISYQRLQRIFNQGAVLTATELLFLSVYLDLKLGDFILNDEPPYQEDQKTTKSAQAS